MLLADANTNGFCIPVWKKLFPAFKGASSIVIPKGEQNKTLEVCSLIWHELDKFQADRSTLLINIGGGMVSDMGGFAASVYKRGIEFINIPTTFLAMVDACYGGKTGIDFHGVKNNLGTFLHPSAIYIHPIFLQTLDERILQSGLAESIKHALLSSSDHLNKLSTCPFNEMISMDMIRLSLETKIAIVEHDEKDEGKRQSLNLGHTIGHAIESYSLQTSTPLLHGEAVILGLLHELKLSERIFGLSVEVTIQIEALLKKFFSSLQFEYAFSDIQKFLQHDKKNHGGIRMSLLKQIGECEIQVPVTNNQIQETFSQ